MKKNKSILSDERIYFPLFILLISGLILRIILFFAFDPASHLDEVLRYDAEGYHKLALQLSEHGTFIIPGSDLDTFRTPGYPFFIYLIYLVFGVKPHLIIAVQIFINLASVSVLYCIGKSLFNKKVGFISALLLCLEPDHIYYEYSVLSDTLFVFIFLLSVLCLIYYIKGHKRLSLIAASLLTGIASLVRPVNVYFPVVMIFIIIIHAISDKKYSISSILKDSAIVAVFSLLPVFPWLLRNYCLYDELRMTSFKGYNLLNYNTAFTIKKHDNRTIDEIRKGLDSLVVIKGGYEKPDDPFHKSKIESKVAVDYIRKHKVDYLGAHFKGMINIYLSMDFKPHLHRFFKMKDYTESKRGNFDRLAIDPGRFKAMPASHIIVGCFYALLLLFYYSSALGGSIKLLMERRYWLLLSLLVIILYFTFLTGIVGMPRYKLPISPFYILLSAYCLFLISSKKYDRKSYSFSTSGLGVSATLT